MAMRNRTLAWDTVVTAMQHGRRPQIGSIPLPRLSSSTTPKMRLAQELVDYVIDSLHDDPTTLLQVSLVSKAWVGRTRAHLCKSLKITDSKLSSSDPSHLTPLCRYVKILHLIWPADATDASAILDCFEQTGPHTLVVHSCDLYTLDEQTLRRCFAKFPRTSITALELRNISPSHETFLILLSLFPNADDLAISVNKWITGQGPDDDEITQFTSPPRLRGSLKLLSPPRDGPRSLRLDRTLHTIAALPLQFQTISLDYDEQSRGDVSNLLQSCSKTVRKAFVGPPRRKSQLLYSTRCSVLSVQTPSESLDRLAKPFRFHEPRGTTR